MPTCAAVADHVLALLTPNDASPDHAQQVRDVLDRRCRDDRWALDVTSCMIGEGDLHARHHCQDKLTAEQRIAFNRDLVAIDAPPPAPPGPHDWPSECDDYESMVTELQSCSAMTEQQRDMIKRVFVQGTPNWDHLQGDERTAAAVECESRAELLRQAATACMQP